MRGDSKKMRIRQVVLKKFFSLVHILISSGI